MKNPEVFYLEVSTKEPLDEVSIFVITPDGIHRNLETLLSRNVRWELAGW